MIRVNAVLGKELTTRMRGWRAAAILTGYLAFLAAVSLAVLSSPNAPQSYAESANLGKNLFTWLAGFQMALIIFVTPASTADAISGERQRQTLDLLLATRLSSLSIVLGKLVAGLAFDLLLILCSLPLFSLVFLFGGVSPDQFVSMFVVFLATTLLLGALGLFISTVTRRSGAAIVVSMLCTLGLTVGLALLSIYLAATTANNNPGGTPPMPVTAYFDPLVGFAAALPDSMFAPSAHFSAGPLHLALWQDQVIADLILAALFILASVRLLRPHWVPR
jgi:ABC-2 type transport system permease protein